MYVENIVRPGERGDDDGDAAVLPAFEFHR